MNPSTIINRYHLRPRKRLGQNFLVDGNVLGNLIDALALRPNDRVLEIGAGFGVLTAACAEQCREVIAVECDEELCTVLDAEVVAHHANVRVLRSSIFKVNLTDIAGSEKLTVVGNVPYYITSDIIFYLIEQRAHITEAVLTMQKEVAERLCALPGSKAYGRLTVAVRFFADVEHVFDIKARSFFPVPDVASATVRLRFRTTMPADIDVTLFLDIVAALFNQRRKQIINSLGLLKRPVLTKDDARAIFKACRIAPTRRAEELMLKDFLAITREIMKKTT